MAGKRLVLPKAAQHVQLVDREQLRLKKGTKMARLPAKFKPGGGIEPPPKSFNWSKYHTIPFPVLGNDAYGDCFYVAAAHMVQLWTGNVSTPEAFDVGKLVSRYLSISGGDNGLSDDQIFPEWKGGIIGPDGPHRILDYMLVTPSNAELVNLCLYYFGGCIYTASLLNTWLDNAAPGATWDAGGRPDRYAGHAMLLSAVNENGNFDDETWGFNPPIQLTRAGMLASDPEIVAVFSLDWFDRNGIAPNGKNYVQLAALWKELGGATLPPSPFVEPPAPGPGPGPGPGPAPTPVDEVVTLTLPDFTWESTGSDATGPNPEEVWKSSGTVKAAGQIKLTIPASMRRAGAIPWQLILVLLAKYLPIVLADLAAGKTWEQILLDLLGQQNAGNKIKLKNQ